MRYVFLILAPYAIVWALTRLADHLGPGSWAAEILKPLGG